ncbi:MAG: DUF4214 domain-containing protein [Paracoccaceae bacterium]
MVEASNFDLPGAGTPYSAFALFDTDTAAGDPDAFGDIPFEDALIAFEATIGGETVVLDRTGDVEQSGADLVSASFGRGGTLIDPGVDALEGSVGGLEALYGNFEISSFPGDPDLFTNATALLSGVGPMGLEIDRTSFDTFELTLDNPSSFADGFVIADIAEGSFALADEDGRPIGPGEGFVPNDAQAVALLYEAGLDRDGEIDLPGLNFWIDQREAGLSIEETARFFLDSDEFEVAYGPPEALSDRELVERLYLNVLDRPGEAEGVDFWTGVVGQSDFSRAELLYEFAVSVENTEALAFVETLTEVEPGEWAFV